MLNSTSLAWILPILAVLVFVAIGLRAGARVDSADDEFLTGGRGFGPSVIALSIFATSNTGFMFVGAIGAGYSTGIAALWVPLAWFAGETVFWLLFPERIHSIAEERRPLSIPDYIAKSLPKNQRRMVQSAAGAVIVLAMMPYILGQGIAAGKAFSVLSGFSLQTSVLVAGGSATCVALLYCATGGLRSSILANTLQGAFVLAVSLVVATVVGWSLFMENEAFEAITLNNADALNIFALHGPILTAAFVLGAATASFGSAMSLPTLLMRVTVAGSEDDLRAARWWYLGICYGFWGVMSLMGTALSGIIPSTEDPEQALFLFAAATSPWLLGLTVAGITALILSTMDGSIMVGGSALSDDMCGAAEVSENWRRTLRVGGLVIFAGTALAGAYFLASASVYEIVLFGVSALAGGIGPAFMITTLGWRTNGVALTATILVGAATAVAWAAAGLSSYVAEALPSFIVGLTCHAIIIASFSRSPKLEKSVENR